MSPVAVNTWPILILSSVTVYLLSVKALPSTVIPVMAPPGFIIFKGDVYVVADHVVDGIPVNTGAGAPVMATKGISFEFA